MVFKIATINQVCKRKRERKQKRNKTPALKGCPQKRGLVVKLVIRTPKKPNSALRKVAKIKIPGNRDRRIITAYVPGEGHNLQRFCTVLMRGGRVKDLPGVKYHLIRGKFDFDGLKNRVTSRSKYGTKRVKKYL